MRKGHISTLIDSSGSQELGHSYRRNNAALGKVCFSFKPQDDRVFFKYTRGISSLINAI